MIFLGILIGIILMQTITFLVAKFSDENEELMTYVSVSLFMPFILLLRFLFRNIKRHKKQNIKKE